MAAPDHPRRPPTAQSSRERMPLGSRGGLWAARRPARRCLRQWGTKSGRLLPGRGAQLGRIPKGPTEFLYSNYLPSPIYIYIALPKSPIPKNLQRLWSWNSTTTTAALVGVNRSPRSSQLPGRIEAPLSHRLNAVRRSSAVRGQAGGGRGGGGGRSRGAARASDLELPFLSESRVTQLKCLYKTQHSAYLCC
jgi:hypothetical protein